MYSHVWPLFIVLKTRSHFKSYLKEIENFLVYGSARHCQLLLMWAPTMRTFLKIPSTLDCVRNVLLARCCVFLNFHIFFALEHWACLMCLTCTGIRGDFWLLSYEFGAPFKCIVWFLGWHHHTYPLPSWIPTPLFSNLVLHWYVGPGIWWFAAWIHDGMQTGVWGESSYPGIQLLYLSTGVW